MMKYKIDNTSIVNNDGTEIQPVITLDGTLKLTLDINILTLAGACAVMNRHEIAPEEINEMFPMSRKEIKNEVELLIALGYAPSV